MDLSTEDTEGTENQGIQLFSSVISVSSVDRGFSVKQAHIPINSLIF